MPYVNKTDRKNLTNVPPREYVEARSIPVTETGCWLWTGAVNSLGYGSMRRDCVRMSAHRFAFKAFNGPLADDQVVMHTCDTPRCVNPAHLRAGTQPENLDDMRRKGRSNQPVGERIWSAKLTAEQVLAIRASSESRRALKRRYGVGDATIRNIKDGKRWTHLADFHRDRVAKGEK